MYIQIIAVLLVLHMLGCVSSTRLQTNSQLNVLADHMNVTSTDSIFQNEIKSLPKL